MTKKTKKAKTDERGKQLDLIDTQPKNAKEIIAAARSYKKFQITRMAALRKEIEQKQKILTLVKAENLQTVTGGKIKFELDGMIISIVPRDELITVKETTEPE